MLNTRFKTGVQQLFAAGKMAVAVCLLCTTGTVFSDSSINAAAGVTERHSNGGFLELGVGVEIKRTIRHALDPEESEDYALGLTLEFSAGYRFGRLFVEAKRGVLGGLNAGITLTESEHWDFDILLASISGNYTSSPDEPYVPVTESERNADIVNRDTFYVAAGGRLTGYFDDNIVQLRVLSDWHEYNGMLGSLRAGRQWQLGNWNAQALAGFRYHSAQFNDYQFGVDEAEQSARFPSYKAGSALIPEVELTVSVPVKKSWVYSSMLRYTQFPSSVTNSPLVNNNSAFSLSTGIYYVF